ncbi:MAG: SRPBCC family protein [Candidatus Levyibacteriota bacterium]|jgi:uncharacterized membrane protein
MKQINIEATVDLPVEKVWQLFINPENYPKYFKFVHAVFYKGEMKLGYRWFDLATVVYFPALVLHQVTKFEKEKTLEFYCPLPLIGGIRETVDFEEKDKKTYIKGLITYSYGPIFGPMFNKIFEKRFSEMIYGAIDKFKKNL